MPWTRLALTTLALLATTAAFADVIVIRANGPSAARYVAGRTLPDSTRLTLQKGDQIVLLDAHGTRIFVGPGSFPVTGAPVAAAGPSLAMITGNAGRRARVGAVRNRPGLDGTEPRPNIFLVDVAAPGKACIVDPAKVTLWRADAQVAGSSTITADGKSASVTWIKGQSTQPWPSTLPVAQGLDYRIDPPTAAGKPKTIQFQLLDKSPADLPQLAQALIAHGCQAQIDLLVATTSAPAATGG